MTVTILSDGQTHVIGTSAGTPEKIISQAKLTLETNDCVFYLDSRVPPDFLLPKTGSITLSIRRAFPITLITPDGQKTVHSCAQTVGQALVEIGYNLYHADRIDPPAETPIETSLTITYQPSQPLVVTVDGTQVQVRSAAQSVGQALADGGISLTALDYSIPADDEPLPVNGRIQVVRVVESIELTQNPIPYATRTEPSADLELDQQALLQGGEPGLAVARIRSRYENGIETSRETESESVVRPAQDRILGYGTRVVIRSTEVDGEAIEYYRVLTLMVTSYSPCRSATPDGSCSFGTSSGLPVQRGTVAMVYSWYLAFGFDRLYIPGYGYATVGDVGGGPGGNHYWVDLAFTDADYQPYSGTVTVYFLTPVPKNLVYILP